MRHGSTRTCTALALALAALAPAGAQDPRLGMKLDAPTIAAIQAILDTARAQGIPEAPLREKMYQGAAMGVDGPRIVAAVRSLATEMASAHLVLGTVASA